MSSSSLPLPCIQSPRPKRRAARSILSSLSLSPPCSLVSCSWSWFWFRLWCALFSSRYISVRVLRSHASSLSFLLPLRPESRRVKRRQRLRRRREWTDDVPEDEPDEAAMLGADCVGDMRDGSEAMATSSRQTEMRFTLWGGRCVMCSSMVGEIRPTRGPGPWRGVGDACCRSGRSPRTEGGKMTFNVFQRKRTETIVDD